MAGPLSLKLRRRFPAKGRAGRSTARATVRAYLRAAACCRRPAGGGNRPALFVPKAHPSPHPQLPSFHQRYRLRRPPTASVPAGQSANFLLRPSLRRKTDNPAFLWERPTNVSRRKSFPLDFITAAGRLTTAPQILPMPHHYHYHPRRSAGRLHQANLPPQSSILSDISIAPDFRNAIGVELGRSANRSTRQSTSRRGKPNAAIRWSLFRASPCSPRLAASLGRQNGQFSSPRRNSLPAASTLTPDRARSVAGPRGQGKSSAARHHHQ